MPRQPAPEDGIKQRKVESGWEWTLRCARCPAESAPSPVRPAAVCLGILDGWQVGWGEVLCPSCTLTYGQDVRKTRLR